MKNTADFKLAGRLFLAMNALAWALIIFNTLLDLPDLLFGRFFSMLMFIPTVFAVHYYFKKKLGNRPDFYLKQRLLTGILSAFYMFLGTIHFSDYLILTFRSEVLENVRISEIPEQDEKYVFFKVDKYRMATEKMLEKDVTEPWEASKTKVYRYLSFAVPLLENEEEPAGLWIGTSFSENTVHGRTSADSIRAKFLARLGKKVRYFKKETNKYSNFDKDTVRAMIKEARPAAKKVIFMEPSESPDWLKKQALTALAKVVAGVWSVWLIGMTLFRLFGGK